MLKETCLYHCDNTISLKLHSAWHCTINIRAATCGQKVTLLLFWLILLILWYRYKIALQFSTYIHMFCEHIYFLFEDKNNNWYQDFEKIPYLLQWRNFRCQNFTYFFILYSKTWIIITVYTVFSTTENIPDIKIGIWLLANVGFLTPSKWLFI